VTKERAVTEPTGPDEIASPGDTRWKSRASVILAGSGVVLATAMATLATVTSSNAAAPANVPSPIIQDPGTDGGSPVVLLPSSVSPVTKNSTPTTTSATTPTTTSSRRVVMTFTTTPNQPVHTPSRPTHTQPTTKPYTPPPPPVTTTNSPPPVTTTTNPPPPSTTSTTPAGH
jgi:hypothetical protein